jgi:two-component system, response regulator YcbB
MKVYIIDNSIVNLGWIAEIGLYHKGLEIIGISGKADDAVKKIKVLNPDLVIINYNLFRVNFNDLIKKIKTIKPGIRIAAIQNKKSPELKNVCVNLGIDYFFLQTTNYSEKIHEVLINIALTSSLPDARYNSSPLNLSTWKL